MTPNTVYGGSSVLATLDIEADLARTLLLGEQHDVDMVLSFVTMVCETFQEQNVKSPETLSQVYYTSMERFCRRYASRKDVVELLNFVHHDALSLLIRRFFLLDKKRACEIPMLVKGVFLRDLQNTVFPTQSSFLLKISKR